MSLQETAIIERQIKVSLSKLTTLEPAQTEHFMFMKNNPHILQKLGKSLLLLVLKLTDEEILKDRMEIISKIESAADGKIKSSRIRNNLAALMHAYRLLRRVCDDLRITLPVSEQQVLDAVVTVVLADTLDSTAETLSAVDYTLQNIDVMLLKEHKYFDPNDPNYQPTHVKRSSFSATITGGQNFEKDYCIDIDITRLYPEYRQYHKTCNLDTELLSERDFKKNIKGMPYFVWYGTMRFKGGGNRGFRLNINLARKRGLDLPFLFQVSGLPEEKNDEKA